MDEVSGLLFSVINSVLLIKYFTAFLTSKSKKIPECITFIGFGFSYFLAQYLTLWLLSLTGLDVSVGIPDPAVMSSIPIILMLLVFLLSSVLFKEYTGIRLFLICSFFAAQDICYYISMWVFNLPFSDNYLILANIAQISTYAVIFFLSLHYIIKSFSYKEQLFSPIEILYLLLPCVSGLMLVSVMKIINYKIDMSGNLELAARVPLAMFLVPLAGFIYLFNLVAAVKLFQKSAELHIEERERIVLQKQTQQLHEQIRDVSSIYTEIRGMRHDMKSHISNIRLLIKAVMDGNRDVSKELEEYFDKFKNTLDRFEFAYQTGNSITDVIIHQKSLEAANNGTSFSADFLYPMNLNIDVYDLAVILNNALENAIEACNGVTPAERFIRVYSYIKGEMFFIGIENSFTGPLTINGHTHLPVSSKADKFAHGMGLSNIKRCAVKYYGDIDIQISNVQSNSIFHLTVMLQGRDDGVLSNT